MKVKLRLWKELLYCVNACAGFWITIPHLLGHTGERSTDGLSWVGTDYIPMLLYDQNIMPGVGAGITG